MDAMKQWYAEKPHLFTKIPRNRQGPDKYTARIDMVWDGRFWFGSSQSTNFLLL